MEVQTNALLATLTNNNPKVHMHCQNMLCWACTGQKMEPSQKSRVVLQTKKKREGFNTTLFPGGPPPQY